MGSGNDGNYTGSGWYPKKHAGFPGAGVSMEPTINDNDIILAEQRFSFDEISDKKGVFRFSAAGFCRHFFISSLVFLFMSQNIIF